MRGEIGEVAGIDAGFTFGAGVGVDRDGDLQDQDHLSGHARKGQKKNLRAR